MTAKKKHLIELMIEAGIKWPDGAEYAAQDKDSWLAFYTRKPYREDGKVTWSSYRCYVDNSMKKLDLLCRNWHRTIVTREQYAEALYANVGEPVDMSEQSNQVRESEDVPASQPAAKYCASVMRQMPDETIESLLAEIKAKREKRDALVAKADALSLEIASIEQRVNDKLKEYGFAMFQLAAASEPEQLAITDWRDLRVGDVIECVAYGDERDEPYPGGWASRNIGNEQVVSEINVKSGKISIKKGQDSGRAFRFIRRP